MAPISTDMYPPEESQAGVSLSLFSVECAGASFGSMAKSKIHPLALAWRIKRREGCILGVECREMQNEF